MDELLTFDFLKEVNSSRMNRSGGASRCRFNTTPPPSELTTLWQELDASLETLTSAFETATSEKLRCQEEVNRTNKTIELANRLVKGLEVGLASACFPLVIVSKSSSDVTFIDN